MDEIQNLKLPDELQTASEEQYAAYVVKVLSKNRMGLAPVNALSLLEIHSAKIVALAAQSKTSETADSGWMDTALSLLSQCVGNEIDFGNPAIRLAALGFTINHRLNRFPDSFRRKLLSGPDSLYHSENEVLDKKEALEREFKKKDNHGNFPDLSDLSNNLKKLDGIVQAGVLTDEQTEAVQSIAAIGEWVLLNGPAIERGLANNQKADILPTAKEIKEWAPTKFFKWFDNAIDRHPRKDLSKLAKSWIASQAGQHEFADMRPEDAMAAKKEFAKSIMAVIDALEIKVECGADGCGQMARIRTGRTGSSVNGQYFFSHPGKNPGETTKHSLSNSFPKLKLI